MERQNYSFNYFPPHSILTANHQFTIHHEAQVSKLEALLIRKNCRFFVSNESDHTSAFAYRSSLFLSNWFYSHPI